MITIDEFKKVEIKIGTIIAADIVAESDKLIRFDVDFGNEQRQILSGIREYFPDPNILIGNQVPVVTNLAPRTIRGLESNGMILYAVGDTTFTTLEPAIKVPNGTNIS